MRKAMLTVLGFTMLLGGGCSKGKSACEKRCDKLLTCYSETRGEVKDRAASLKRCARLCGAKARTPYKRAIEQFGSLSCTEFMKRYRIQADYLVRGGSGPGRRAGARGRAQAMVNPFPDLVGKPPKDPRARRTWQSPVHRRVDRIVIRKPKETIELRRQAAGKRPGDPGTWKLVQPEQTRADRYAVRNLLNRLERMRFQRADTISPKDFPRYAVDDKHGIRCTVYAGTEVLADFVVGRADRTGPKRRGPVSTVVRKAGGNEVYRVMGSLTYLFKRPARAWRDSTVIQIERENVKRLELHTQKGMLVVERDPNETNPRRRFSNWKIVQAKPALASLDQNAVTRLVTVLAHLRATGTPPKLQGVDTGLAKPRARVVLVDKAGKRVVLRIGNKEGRSRSAFGQVEGASQVFRLRAPLMDLPDRPISAFRDKTLIPAKLDQVVAVGVERDGKWTRFAKKGQQWVAVEPKGFAFSRATLIRTVRLLEGRLAGYEFATRTDPAVTGLDKPRGRIEVRYKPAPDQAAKTVTILVGKQGVRGDFHVQVQGSRDVLLVRRWVLDRVWRAPSSWQERGRARGPSRRNRLPRHP